MLEPNAIWNTRQAPPSNQTQLDDNIGRVLLFGQAEAQGFVREGKQIGNVVPRLLNREL